MSDRLADRAAALAVMDKRYVWHPFTQMRDWLADDPLIIDAADGNYLIDVQGRRYLDGVSSLWVNVHGHRRAEIDQAVRAQLDRVAHSTLLGLANVPSIELAERLIQVAPRGLGKVFYSDNGSTAVEIALKISYQYWCHRGRPEKSRFVSLSQAYHGDTIGSVSVGGIDLFHQIFRPLLFDALHVPTPYWYRHPETPDPQTCRDLCLAALERILTERAHEIAAFVVEPLVQGAAGVITQPTGYLRRAAELCRAHDVLLICDEVATGFGRTGSLFACTQEGVSPDLLCLAKGITGGYLPLAATLASDEIYEAFLGTYQTRRTFFHGHTYTGNPLACAAAIASLDVFERDRVLENLAPKIEALAALLSSELAPLAHVGQIRQRGFMVGIELVRDRATKQEYPFEVAIGARVCRTARAHGVLLRPLGPVIVLMPPLSTTEAELRHLVTATRAAIVAETEHSLAPADVETQVTAAEYFVTGTDTAVGKTTVSAGILAALHGRGMSVAALKPAESGCPLVNGELLPSDGQLLRAAAGLADVSLDVIVPHRLATPVAPAVASRQESQPFDWNRVVRARARLLERRPRLLLVEGAGGLLVPYADDLLAADLAARLELPLLVVARASLGTINHTLLTVFEARRRGLTVAGIILNRVIAEAGPDEPTNAAELERWTGVRVLGTVEHLPVDARRDPAALARAVTTAFDPASLCRQVTVA